MLKKFMNTHPIQTYFIEDLILLLLVVAFNLVMGSTSCSFDKPSCTLDLRTIFMYVFISVRA